ncbi:FadD3 family acyl-CoA ligase [Actinoplanes sp. NEAU-A12]|uniref:FadD3 family acyl-CoA ligase n=1 Tax=Actinoplanes sandaracinus TaxID=3045177 RepID=A0ABT6WCD2_9ACTN|nr:FadD3 family acyl-CoA ligase [Actinoplanes sandaracinus]MDI6097401.1 FadD3 family acyl-CoA ligase [Actinoplanes sandaracinus]
METIPAAVARAARDYGTEPALVDPFVRRWNFAELHDEVRTVARALIASGIQAGDRVALWAPNSARWMLAALGVSYAGAVLVPVNTRFTGAEAADVIVRSRARGLIVTGPFLGVDRLASLPAPTLPPFVLPLPHWDAFLDRASLVPAALADSRAAAVREDDVSDILFTSGTTGRSKGAMSAHRQSLGVAQAWATIGGLGVHDRYLVVNPFFHSFGLKAGILACLTSGATVVPQAVFDVPRTLDLIGHERITVLPGPPTLYIGLLDHPARAGLAPTSLRLAVTGAATVPPALVERIRAELGFTTVLTAYGLTEAVVATMCRPGDDTRTVAYTCGRAAAGFSVRISEKDGEVLLRGPNVMLGYLDDPVATADAIDGDGWLHTGDVGTLDERGNLTITDRLKDMYVCGGFNVYPAEVERVLAELPAVAESAVVGVPDDRLGEVGRAYVVARPGHELTAEAVIGWCRDRLAGYKAPRSVEVLPELPHNAGGKVLKYLLRERS